MTINRCILMFNIQSNKTLDITLELFKACETYVTDQVESLYQKTLKLKKLEDAYSSILINGIRYYRSQERIPRILNRVPCLTIDPSLMEDGYKLESFVKQAKQDARFIQMWLASVIDVDNPQVTKSLMPPALARITEYATCNAEYRIPKDKEELWHQAEEKINFYLGLKLVL